MGSFAEETPFTLDNIPYGVITTADNPRPRCATAFGDNAVDLYKLETDGFFASIPGLAEHVFSEPNLNRFAASSRNSRIEVRNRLVKFLSSATSEENRKSYFIPLKDVTNHWPMATSNFSDFLCSEEHAKNCSALFGLKVNPNWYQIPSVYNGRTSSLKVSGQPIRRPWGVMQHASSTTETIWSPTKKIDFELEMGIFLSKPVPSGQILDIRQASEHIFGFVILNDWSSRDIQTYEMNPLGPFHGKGFGTTISPWIVTMEALHPTKCRVSIPQSPSPLSHLLWKGEDECATFYIELYARILRKDKTFLVTSTNLRELYWSPYQQLTHLASAGEGLATGDIYGTGTISSDRLNSDDEKIGIACLWERTLPQNQLSSLKECKIEYIEDEDEVIMEAWCFNSQTGKWFGFGECRAKIVPPLTLEGSNEQRTLN